MKEYNVELTVNKTFTVNANSIEEAKEKAIKVTRSTLGYYNTLTIEDVTEEIEEDLDWDYEYDVKITTVTGNVYHCSIEADDVDSAEMVAREFFADDHPDEMIETIEIQLEAEEE